MIPRIAFVAAIAAVAAFVLWHPARAPMVQSAATPPALPPAMAAIGSRPHRHSRVSDGAGDDIVVYVAGAVRKPGLYHLRTGERNARAVELAGGLTAAADAGAVNLAQRSGDGDEIYVPAAGEARSHHASSSPRTRRHRSAPPNGSVDVNTSDAAQLAAVPGIGRAIAARIIELRRREGSFGSLDELLDAAGMTQTRLERARPYLRQP
jgi:competence protein ComEA